MLLLISRVFCLVLIYNFHAFHVSVCEVYHNPDTKNLEISMKVFRDDIELAIHGQGYSEFSLEETTAQEEEFLKAYITKHYIISVDGNKMDLNWVGFEVKWDYLQCYLESKKIEKISIIEFDNSLLTEVFDDQINLVHFQYKDEMKSLKATKDYPRQEINASDW